MEDDQKTAEMIRELTELESVEEKEKKALGKLLTKYSQLKGTVFALRAEMGKTKDEGHSSRPIPSFTATHTLMWIAANIKMGSEMPFMESAIDPETGRIIIDESNAEEIRQRAPDWRRQPAIAAYLCQSKTRKFSSILAVVSPSWVDDPQSENWDPDGRAVVDAVRFESLDLDGQIGLLAVEGVHLYALDGQHRIMGMKGVRDIQSGGLEFRRKDGTPLRQSRMTRDAFLEQFHIDLSTLQSILDEEMVVEYLPAVVVGETRKEAVERVRSIFNVVNKYSEKPDKGEEALLDENDGFSMVGRRVGTTHALFKDSTGTSRVNWKSTSVPKSSAELTTLQTLKVISRDYLTGLDRQRYSEWEPFFAGQVPIKPSDEELEEAQDRVCRFFNHFQQFPIIKRYESGDSIFSLREVQWKEGGIDKPGLANVLLRPVGQEVIARVVGHLVGTGKDEDELFEKLYTFDREDGFTISRTSSLWYGVLFNQGKGTVNMKGRGLACDILAYLLIGAVEPDREELLAQIVDARRVSDDQWTGFDGKLYNVEGHSQDLPSPIKIR